MICSNCGRAFNHVALPGFHLGIKCPTCQTVLSVIADPKPPKKSTRRSKKIGTRQKRMTS